MALSDLLKYELTPHTRTTVSAAPGTKAGTFIDFPPRPGVKLLALTDERDGMVTVQPHNCIINLDQVRAEALAQAGGMNAVVAAGDPYGIVYAGAAADGGAILPPTVSPPAPPSAPKEPPAVQKAVGIITFGDSTMSLIDEPLQKAMAPLSVDRRAVGGTLVQHAMMEAGALDIGITFSESTVPAYVNNNTTVPAALSYPGETININGFAFTLEGAGANTFHLLGQTASVKVLPNRNNKTPTEVETGKRYALLPVKGRLNTPAPVVVATCKNNLNGAPEVRTAPVLEFCKAQTRALCDWLNNFSNNRVVLCTQWKDNNAAYRAPNKARMMQDYNDFLRQEYGTHLFDLEEYVMSESIWTDSGIEPSEEDREAQKQRLLPMGLSRDSGAHLKPEANAAAARKLQAHLIGLGWI